MKKKMLILCSLITLLLAAFQFPIYADEDPTDPPSSVPIPNSIRLDQYFFDNYDLLPYIESDGRQYINTGIKPSEIDEFDIKYSFTNIVEGQSYGVFGTPYVENNGFSHYLNVSQKPQFYLLGYYYAYDNLSNIYELNHAYLRNDNLYFNYVLLGSVDLSNIENNNNINLFYNGSNFSSIRLFSFYMKNDGEFVKYYYPARSKAGGVVGLYDAVSDTFVTTSGTVPFLSPVNDQVLDLQIGTFLTSSISWITDILEFAIETPIILMFMSIGLAGVMFRWGRRLVHF